VNVRKFLCLFSSEDLRGISCFSGNGGWQDLTDFGRCDFVPHVLDPDAPALVHSGLFFAVTLLARPAELEVLAPTFGAEGLAALYRPGTSLEIVASESPIDLLAWLSSHAPALVPSYRQDGEVLFRSPGWWRRRADRHFGVLQHEAAAAPPDGEDPSAEALRAFVSRRRG